MKPGKMVSIAICFSDFCVIFMKKYGNMKTITIDIADHMYKRFRDFLELLPGDCFRIYEEDPDGLTANEIKEVYAIKKKIENGDISDFEEWEKVKSAL